MASEKSELLGTVVVIVGASVGTVATGVVLSRTRLAPGYKGIIAAGAQFAAGLGALALGMPNLGKGLIAGGVLQGGMYGGKQLALMRYLGAADSKTALPAAATAAAAALAATAATAAGATASTTTPATTTTAAT